MHNLGFKEHAVVASKVVGVVALALGIVAIIGVYHGQKLNKIETIEKITEMKLAYGWKPDKACQFLNHVNLKPKKYHATDDSEIYNCSDSIRMPFSKGDATILYKVTGVENNASIVELTLVINDKMPTKQYDDNQQNELKQFKQVFDGISKDLIFISTGKLLDSKEIGRLEGIKLNQHLKFSSDLFNSDVHYYQIKNGAWAYNLNVSGKKALKLRGESQNSVQNK